jgi:hypothetical protein
MPVGVNLEIEGLAEVLDKFLQGNARLGKALLRATLASTEKIRRAMALYPDPRPESTYDRTTTLGKKWHKKATMTSDDVLGLVGNTAPYAPYVQSYDKQAAMHWGTWQTDKQVVNETRDAINEIFAEEISRAMLADKD